jgi:hypothetical protein
MKRMAGLVALGVLTVTPFAMPAVAQSPKPSDDAPAIFDRSEPTKSKSDAYRFVGKVRKIDHQAGTFELETEEGVVTARPRRELLMAARVGDTVSVPRDENSDVPSASPRVRNRNDRSR